MGQAKSTTTTCTPAVVNGTHFRREDCSLTPIVNGAECVEPGLCFTDFSPRETKVPIRAYTPISFCRTVLTGKFNYVDSYAEVIIPPGTEIDQEQGATLDGHSFYSVSRAHVVDAPIIGWYLELPRDVPNDCIRLVHAWGKQDLIENVTDNN